VRICSCALAKWGPELQIMVLFEEMAELQKELCKVVRGNTDSVSNIDSIAEEIADVEILLTQMKLLFEVFIKVEEWKKVKLRRLAERLQGCDL